MTDTIDRAQDDEQRDAIKTILGSGLETEVFPRADTHEEIQNIVARLHQAKGDLKAKLVIAGFADRAVEHGGLEQLCETCMYYLVHRKYCELPELDCPVEPHWSCRLWRI